MDIKSCETSETIKEIVKERENVIKGIKTVKK